MRTLIVFEDAALSAFEILTTMRGVFDLRCGARTLLERLQTASKATHVLLLARPELHALLREAHPESQVGGQLRSLADSSPSGTAQCVFLNGRLLALGHDVQRLLSGPPAGCAVLAGDVLVAANCPQEAGARLAEFLQSGLHTNPSGAIAGGADLESWLQKEYPEFVIRRLDDERQLVADGSRLMQHSWDLVQHNKAALVDDFGGHYAAGVESSACLEAGVHLLAESAIHLAAGARIHPGTVLDAEDGPIIIDAGAVIQANSVIRGPTYIGPQSMIKAGARIHEGTSLGPHCKVGGEVEESVVQGYSNKQHDGFLGHAFIGEWVNLGADTNNSDLKNNYSTVRVWEAGDFVDSGQLFVGLIAADHVKSAINTQFNTGTVVGMSSQIFGSGFPPKYVPPFSWGGAEGLTTYDYAKALHTARSVMERRQCDLSLAYEATFKLAFDRSRMRHSE